MSHFNEDNGFDPFDDPDDYRQRLPFFETLDEEDYEDDMFDLDIELDKWIDG